MWNFHGSWFLTLEFPQTDILQGFLSEKVCMYIYIYIYIFNAPVWCFPGIALHGECLAYPLPDYQDQAYLD